MSLHSENARKQLEIFNEHFKLRLTETSYPNEGVGEPIIMMKRIRLVRAASNFNVCVKLKDAGR